VLTLQLEVIIVELALMVVLVAWVLVELCGKR
jgi:hypothetical protein